MTFSTIPASPPTIWVVRNNKKPERQGKVQLINGSIFFEKMGKSLGKKRNFIPDEKIDELIEIHKAFKESEHSKIFDNDDFAYRKVFLDLEELDDEGNPVYITKQISLPANKLKKIVRIETDEEKGSLEWVLDKTHGEEVGARFDLIPDSDFIQLHKTPQRTIMIEQVLSGNRLSLQAEIEVPLIVKDTENIPWKTDVETFLRDNVEKPWNITETKVGYEIPFTQFFYQYEPLRSADEVLAEFVELERANAALLKELSMNIA
jgi:type I restriction enzyme M protein